MADDRQSQQGGDPDESPLDGADSGGSGGGGPSSASRPGGSPASGPPTTPQPQSGSGGSEPTNPFEAMLRAFGTGQGGGDLNALLQQMQTAFAAMFPGVSGVPGGGSPLAGGGLFGRGQPEPGSGVNWEVTKDIARQTAASLGPDPTPNTAQVRAITDAVSLAELWLDEATALPRHGGKVAAWSRADWIEQTLTVWRRLVEPVASHIADAMESALGSAGQAEGAGQLAGMEQMLRPLLRSSGATMFGFQLGQGLGQLATEVVGVTDIGLPLSSQVALLPTNVAKFGEGLDQTATDVTVYLALRECARQRLFASTNWLSSQILTLVEQYAAGITIDTSALEEVVGQLDPANLEELSGKLEGSLFEPQKTPEQLATLARLETMLALVEGWVDDVVSEASARWMPSAPALAETVRRARATGGPAEATFATLVGLELRPRRMRDAAALWSAVRGARGIDGRDAVWSHPDLIPTAADLDAPADFVAGANQPSSDDAFDAALAELLGEARDRPDSPESGGPDPDASPPESAR